MLISREYAILSKDKKRIELPADVQSWLEGVERFVVFIEEDGLILRKAHSRRTLDELVQKETPPLSSEELSQLIHESRK